MPPPSGCALTPFQASTSLDGIARGSFHVREKGLRLAVTLLPGIPWPGAGDDAVPRGGPGGGRGGGSAPPRAAAAAAMAWAPAVGLLLGVAASAVLLLADHPLG